MEQLPLELISRIVYYLDDGRERLNSEKLSQWAILNESWREAVETILFRKLNIAYDDFSMFTQAFAGPRSGRRLKLQSLHITLRAGADEATCITQLSSGMRGFWKELGSWGRSLRVSHLHFCFDCHILSERRELYTKKDLDAAFDPPPLNWVNSLRFTTNEADFPPVLMAALVNRLPALENLWIQGRYQEKRLRFAETEMSFRYNIKKLLEKLPKSPIKLVLDLPYEYSLNHEFIPGCLLLAENLDLFSRSLRQYSLSLAKLVLKANQLSAELFWPADESITDPYWPNLHTLAIRTSTETAEGRWVLHPQDPRFAFFEYAEDMDWDFEDLEELIANSEQLTVEFESGTYPQHTFRARPEHTFFNTLAMSIARAASNMPKLKELLYDMESSARDPSGDRIHGYAFSFHGGDDKQPPRTDWVFPCYHGQLIGWSQPAEASRVWKEKCGGGLIENVLALDDESHGGETSWKVWQNGLDIGIGSDLAEHFQGYEFECHDLLNQ